MLRMYTFLRIIISCVRVHVRIRKVREGSSHARLGRLYGKSNTGAKQTFVIPFLNTRTIIDIIYSMFAQMNIYILGNVSPKIALPLFLPCAAPEQWYIHTLPVSRLFPLCFL